jgi:hypothetical protein
LLLSFNTEAELNKSGAEGMEALIRRVLRNRLRMQRDLRNHPEISEQKIERPLILTGAGRTGSTKLHKMLWAQHRPYYRRARRELRRTNSRGGGKSALVQ